MLQKISNNRDFYFVSLGCPKNLVDSEVMLGVLAKANYKVVTTPEQAGIIVVNTCGFIQDAKDESIDQILEMAQMKQDGLCHTLVVSGCLVQRYAEQLKKNLPEVDMFIGTGEYHRIAEFLTARRISPDAPIHLTEPTYVHSHDTPRILSERKPHAYLKVAEGCMKRCSFCIIPLMRGDLRSRDSADIVQEGWELARQGVKELCIIAQDLTDYGRDLKPFDRHILVSTLQKLSEIKGIEWIRLFYCYPDGITDELIDLMKHNPKICHYFDMPLQHASDRILKRMNRAITRAKMTELLNRLRTEIPQISIRTSLIVGFPGETDEDFQILLDFIKWADLDHVGAFKYSREEGTPSYSLDGQVSPEVIEERWHKAQSLLNELAIARASKKIGSTMRVMIEGVHPDTESLLVARHQGQAPGIDTQVIINDGIDPLKIPVPGSFVDVEITDISGVDLVATVISPLVSVTPQWVERATAPTFV